VTEGKFTQKIERLSKVFVAVQLIPIPPSNWPSNDFSLRRLIVFGIAVNEIA
jgi:hypothetical protein